MAVYDDHNSERADAYRLLANFFLSEPDNDLIEAVKEDFGIESSESFEDIAEDFRLLFSSPGGILPPYERIYVTPSTSFTVDEVAAFYANAGLTFDDESIVMPDHLSLELLFMSYLIDSGRIALQKIFLEQHLLNWVPYYCGEVGKRARSSFYREIASITDDFVAADYEENF